MVMFHAQPYNTSSHHYRTVLRAAILSILAILSCCISDIRPGHGHPKVLQEIAARGTVRIDLWRLELAQIFASVVQHLLQLAAHFLRACTGYRVLLTELPGACLLGSNWKHYQSR